MIGKFFSLFILISFLFSSFAESNGIHELTSSVESEVSSVGSFTTASEIVSADCEDCQENDCGDHTEHCSHHCSGLHNIAPTQSQAALKRPTGINNKVLWYYNHHYKTPFLDPALKPPMFS